MKLKFVAITLAVGLCCGSAVAAQQPDDAIAKQLPVDYRECLLPIFLDLMEQAAPTEELHRYVSVFGRDLDPQFRALFAKRGLTVLPASSQTHNPNDTRTYTSDWEYSIDHLIAEPLGQYSVDAGYHCGALCGGVFHYTFRILGRTCGITSKDMRWVS